MDENTPELNFAEIFSNEAMTSLKNLILRFLKENYNNAQNASLEFPDKTVYIHAHKGDVELHIVDGDRPAPDFPDEDDDE